MISGVVVILLQVGTKLAHGDCPLWYIKLIDSHSPSYSFLALSSPSSSNDVPTMTLVHVVIYRLLFGYRLDSHLSRPFTQDHLPHGVNQ